MPLSVSDRYNTGRVAIRDRAERQQMRIAERIRILKTERSHGVPKERYEQIRAEITRLTDEYDLVSLQTREKLRKLEDQRNFELRQRRAKNRWSF